MHFNKKDENYIYELISKNIKKYRKLKGWTQEKLAEEIGYSLSLIRGIESSYHQTFSLGVLWRISIVLEVDLVKLCQDDTNVTSKKYITFACNKCKTQIKMPIKVAKHYQELYEITDSKGLPEFECTECDGKMKPVNPTDF